MPPRMIKTDVVVLTSTFVAWPHRLASPIISIPALQKAETELKKDIQIPFGPNSGMKTNIYAIAPMTSIMTVPKRTFFTNATRPDMELRLNES